MNDQSGYRSGGMTVGATPRQVSRLEGIASRFDTYSHDAMGLCNQVEAILIRLRGHVPQPPSVLAGVADKAVREPPMIEAIDMAASGIENQQQRMRDMLNELAALV